MASNVSMASRMKGRLSCPICFLQYSTKERVPKTFDCQHTVCQQCTQSLVDMHAPNHFLCPVCRAKVTIPRNSIKGIKTNLALMDVLEVLEEDMRDINAQHPPPASTCKTHLDSVVSHVCMTCHVGLCSKCLVLGMTHPQAQHAQHEIMEVDEALRVMASSVQQLQTQATDMWESGKKVVNEKLAHLESQKTEMVKKIQEKTDLEIKKIIEESDRLKLKVEAWVVNEVSKLPQLETIDQELNKINELGKDGKQKTREFDILHILDSLKDIHCKGEEVLRNLSDTVDPIEINMDQIACCKMKHCAYKKFLSPLLQTVHVYLRSVDTKQRQIFGKQGLIETIIMFIQNRLNVQICDDIYNQSWSVLTWATDECPENCKLFVQKMGLGLATSSLNTFKENTSVDSIVLVLNNVAEVKELQIRFMESEMVQSMLGLLGSYDQDIAYNACGTLANLLVSKKKWPAPGKQDVVMAIQGAIGGWNMDVPVHLVYTSFKPIFHLLASYGIPVVQHYAAWSLCHVVKDNPEEYGKLLKEENGKFILTSVVRNKCIDVNTRQLVEETLTLL